MSEGEVLPGVMQVLVEAMAQKHGLRACKDPRSPGRPHLACVGGANSWRFVLVRPGTRGREDAFQDLLRPRRHFPQTLQALLLELGQMRKIPSCCPTLNGWVFLDVDSLLLASKKRRAPAGS